LTLCIVCRRFFWPFRLFVVFSFDPLHCLSSFLLTLSIVYRLFFWPSLLFVVFSFDPFYCKRVKRKVNKQ
jgi:hypothetical protein